MLKDIVIAISSYRQAHYFIGKHKLWKWIVIPGIFYTVVFCISIYFFARSAGFAIDWLSAETGVQRWIESLQNSVASILYTVAEIILWLILMFFYFSLFKYIWLIFGSPIFACVSEKTGAILEGRENRFNAKQLIKDVIRGVSIALRNTLWQTFYLVVFTVLSFIPVAGWVVPVFALLTECYYYGFSMLDYSLESKQLNASESVRFIRRRKGLAVANGLMFYLLHLLPFIGWLFAPGYAVIAATLSVNDKRIRD